MILLQVGSSWLWLVSQVDERKFNLKSIGESRGNLCSWKRTLNSLTMFNRYNEDLLSPSEVRCNIPSASYVFLVSYPVCKITAYSREKVFLNVQLPVHAFLVPFISLSHIPFHLYCPAKTSFINRQSPNTLPILPPQSLKTTSPANIRFLAFVELGDIRSRSSPKDMHFPPTRELPCCLQSAGYSASFGR